MKILKPCPKCGSERIVVLDNNFWFYCRDCSYSCPVCGTLSEAITAWNTLNRAGDGDQYRETDGSSP